MLPNHMILIFGIIIIGHYIADFLMQSSWQATNKSHNIYALTQHIYTYTLTLTLVLSSLVFVSMVSIEGLIGYTVLNGSLHFFVDYVTSRLSKRAFEQGKISRFWAIIGADQMIHNLCLLSTMPLLMC